MPHSARLFVLAVVLLARPVGLAAQDKPDPRFEHVEAMVPVRDGVKLHTLLYVPREAQGPLPIILIRTPYGIDGRAERDFRAYLKELVQDGYAFAYQDIRGRFGSEGTFVMTRPPRNRHDAKSVDEASDTSDTIDWLLKAVKNNNATPLDVVTNPRKLKLVALDAAQLPRSLDDLAIAAINNDYAEKAGLSFNKDAVIKESPKSPYANLIAVRRADKDKPWARRLVAAYQSPEVKSFIETQFKGSLIPAF